MSERSKTPVAARRHRARHFLAPVGIAAVCIALVAVTRADEKPADVKTDDVKSRVTAHDYFPMSLGDRWIYKKTTTYPGEESAVSETYSLVRGEYLFNGERWFHYEEDGVCFWVFNRDDGQYEASVGYDDETAGLQIEREFLLFKLPAKEGDSWPLLIDFLSDEKPGTVRCLSTSETVVSPAGKFDCYVYEVDEAEAVAKYYIGRGAGMVASEWTFKENGEEIKLELKRFLPGKAAKAR